MEEIQESQQANKQEEAVEQTQETQPANETTPVIKEPKAEEKSATAATKKTQDGQEKTAQKKRDRGPAGLYPGRRKTSVAQVRVVKGSGKITINKRPLQEYFKTPRYQGIVLAPLRLLEQESQLDVFVNVKGGGATGQAEAICHGLARSLDYNFPQSHDKLRKAGFLTRDPRMVERKKYGLHKARRAPQFSKR